MGIFELRRFHADLRGLRSADGRRFIFKERFTQIFGDLRAQIYADYVLKKVSRRFSGIYFRGGIDRKWWKFVEKTEWKIND